MLGSRLAQSVQTLKGSWSGYRRLAIDRLTESATNFSATEFFTDRTLIGRCRMAGNYAQLAQSFHFAGLAFGQMLRKQVEHIFLLQGVISARRPGLA